MRRCTYCGKTFKKSDSMLTIDGMTYHEDCAEELELLPLDDVQEAEDTEKVEDTEDVDDTEEVDDTEDVDDTEEVDDTDEVEGSEEAEDTCETESGFDDPEDDKYECAVCKRTIDGSQDGYLSFKDGKRICNECDVKRDILEMADSIEQESEAVVESKPEKIPIIDRTEVEETVNEGTKVVIVRPEPEAVPEPTIKVQPEETASEPVKTEPAESDDYTICMEKFDQMLNLTGPAVVIEQYNAHKLQSAELKKSGYGMIDRKTMQRLDAAYERAFQDHIKANQEDYGQYVQREDGTYVLESEYRPKKPNLLKRRWPKEEKKEEKKEDGESEEAEDKEETKDKFSKLFKKKDKKSSETGNPDPDSLGEKWRRFKLIHKDGYVIFKTLSRDPNKREYYLDTVLIPKSELPEEAVKVTGQSYTYCLDKIKRSQWYAESRAEVMMTQTPKQRQFSASDGALYMNTNKIDNALATRWQSPFDEGSNRKWLLIAIGVIAVMGVILVRMVM